MATENKFNKTKIRDYLEVVSNSNSGYIKADGDIESKNNLILGNYTLLNGVYTNTGGSIFIKKSGVIYELTRDDLINLFTDISSIKTNVSNINTTLNNVPRLNQTNNFTGTNTFNSSLPTTTITTFNNSNQFVSKGYVDSAISGTSNISSSNFNWTGQHTFNNYLPTSTLTPSTSYQLVNKNYVDSVVSSGSSSLFSSNNNWTGSNTFNDITLNSNSLNSKLSTIETNINSINTLNSTQNNRLDSIDSLNTTQNNRLDNIESTNNSQNTSINNINTNISNINSNLSNYAKLNQTNDFGSYTNTFNIVKINRIEKQDAGTEIYSESPIRINNINFYYKQGISYFRLGDKIDEKLNIYNGSSVNLTSNNGTYNNSTFTGTISGLNKSNVGLSNVDNTSDANKPISSATQTALNLKLNKTSDTLQNATIQNSTLNNCSFSGSTNFNGLGINRCVLYPFIPYSGEEYINTTGGFDYYRTSISICFISSAYSTIDINLFEHGSDYNGYTVTFRKTQAKIMRFYAKNNTKIYDLALSSGQTSKTYTNEYSITITYIYNSSGGKHYVIAENKPT